LNKFQGKKKTESKLTKQIRMVPYHKSPWPLARILLNYPADQETSRIGIFNLPVSLPPFTLYIKNKVPIRKK